MRQAGVIRAAAKQVLLPFSSPLPIPPLPPLPHTTLPPPSPSPLPLFPLPSSPSLLPHSSSPLASPPFSTSSLPLRSLPSHSPPVATPHGQVRQARHAPAPPVRARAARRTCGGGGVGAVFTPYNQRLALHFPPSFPLPHRYTLSPLPAAPPPPFTSSVFPPSLRLSSPVPPPSLPLPALPYRPYPFPSPSALPSAPPFYAPRRPFLWSSSSAAEARRAGRQTLTKRVLTQTEVYALLTLLVPRVCPS
jgi:hypothetical protein